MTKTERFVIEEEIYLWDTLKTQPNLPKLWTRKDIYTRETTEL